MKLRDFSIVALAALGVLSGPAAHAGSLLADAYLPPQFSSSPALIDKVIVVKSERMMYLISSGSVVRSYRVALGRSPQGHKIFQGDGRTPEGLYVLDARNEASRFYRSIRISYPNGFDEARAAEYGSSAGGLIMIHGQPNDSFRGANPAYDWTEGCIAISNPEMDEVWQLVGLGTPIEIMP